jgi:hypothetical protein
MVYRAAWRRGLDDARDRQARVASAIGERYDHGYWLKEKIFREIRQAVRGTQLEKDLTRLYYTGQFEEYARRIAKSRQ